MAEDAEIVTLREVTRDTVREILRLKVSPGQEKFVATNGNSIAEAHYHPATAWYRAIYLGACPVGFVMLEDDSARGTCFLWRLMIDGRYQKRGIGRRAMALIVAEAKSRPGVRALETSCVPGEGGPGPFYEKLGFRPTGAHEEGEVVMRLEWPAE